MSTRNSKILTTLLVPNTAFNELKITFVYDEKREIIPEKNIFISAHIIVRLRSGIKKNIYSARGETF